jgi:two-component system response regulator FixJ
MGHRVIIIDDDEPVLRGLVGVLETAGYEAIGYLSPLKFLADLVWLEPAILVADVSMPEMDGLVMVQQVKALGCSDWPVVIISGHADVPMVVRAVQSGAVDFLEKPFTPTRLLEVVALCVRRSVGDNATTVEDTRGTRSRLAALTDREREILRHLVVGKSSKATALVLGLSPRTIDIFRAKILRKMATDNVASLATLVAPHNLA